jgi:uncharacterized protein YmfQ (DUF2313 family)
MVLSADDYLRQLQALLPPGPAWPRDDDAPLTRELAGISVEPSRIDARATQLAEELDPRTTSELLLDWERVAGLPDACVAASGVTQSTAQRRAALVARLTMIGGQSRAYFIALAAYLGYAITITEFPLHDVCSDVSASLNASPWQYAWQVNAALNTVIELTVADGADDALAAWSNTALECVLNRFKPAHTTLIFSYT